MESEITAAPGENEKLLLGICGRVNARLVFGVEGPLVTAGLVRAAAPGRAGCRLSSLPKPSREDACFSLVRLLLFPEVAEPVGVPASSSADELRLKLEIAWPL